MRDLFLFVLDHCNINAVIVRFPRKRAHTQSTSPPPVCAQVFSTGSVLWNLVWVIDFSMSLYSPLRSSAHLQNYYHLAVWSFTLTTAVYITVLKYYG